MSTKLPITDRVKTFADACKVAKVKQADIIPFSGKKLRRRQKVANAHAKLDLIAEVLREGVVMDYSNHDQFKYRPWFEMSNKPGSGFRFIGSVYVISGTGSAGGSRLCFPTRELSDYFGKQFIALLNEMMLP